VLGTESRSLQVLSPEGKPLAVITPAGGREPFIEYFALDLLNQVYLLDTGNNAIDVFAVKDGAGAVEAERIASVPLEVRPQYKNLKVIGISATGEVVATGKNEDNWVLYR
jgi:hypothetical protein